MSSDSPFYPTAIDDWSDAIQKNLGLNAEEGGLLYQEEQFPYDRLAEWLGREFATDQTILGCPSRQSKIASCLGLRRLSGTELGRNLIRSTGRTIRPVAW